MRPVIQGIKIVLILILFMNKGLTQDTTLFFDSFNDNNNNWIVYEEPGYWAVIDSGSYKIRNITDDNTDRLFVNGAVLNDTIDNFLIEISLSGISSNASAPYGLIWNYKDTKNYCYFRITGKGYFSVIKVIDGEQKMLHNWSFSEYFTSLNGKANKLSVTGTTTRTVLLINDQIVSTMDSQPLIWPKAGVFVPDSMEITINEIAVWAGKSMFEFSDSLNMAYKKVMDVMSEKFLSIRSGDGIEMLGMVIYSLDYMFPFASEGSTALSSDIWSVSYSFGHQMDYITAVKLYNNLVFNLEHLKPSGWQSQTVSDRKSGIRQSYTIYDPDKQFISEKEPLISIMIYGTGNENEVSLYFQFPD